MPRRVAVLCLSVTMPLGLCGAQGSSLRFSAQAIPLVTATNAVPGGASRSEARLVQPVLMIEAAAIGDHLQLHAMGDFAGWTIRHGALASDAYVQDSPPRRHPHTSANDL